MREDDFTHVKTVLNCAMNVLGREFYVDDYGYLRDRYGKEFADEVWYTIEKLSKIVKTINND